MKAFNKNMIPMHQIGFLSQTLFILKEDDSVRLLFKVIEELNYAELYNTYSTIGRNLAIDPAILFRILIYGCMNKLYSRRKIERACNRGINYIWILQGQKTLDHNTIARFTTKRLDEFIDNLINEIIVKIGEI